MPRSMWQRFKDGFRSFVGGMSRQLSDAWTAPSAMQPRLTEMGLDLRSGSGS